MTQAAEICEVQIAQTQNNLATATTSDLNIIYTGRSQL